MKTSPKYRQTVLELTSARQVQISTRSVSPNCQHSREIQAALSPAQVVKHFLALGGYPHQKKGVKLGWEVCSYSFVVFIQVTIRITPQHFATSVEACRQCALQITGTWMSGKALHTGYLLTFRGTALSSSTDLHLPTCDVRLHGRPLPK